MSEKDISDWTKRGKTIKELIQELESFDNQDMEVKISTDGGDTFEPISLVGKQDTICCLITYK